MAGWIAEFQDALVVEFESVNDLGAPGALDRHKTARRKQWDMFQTIGGDGSLEDILTAEKNLLAFELTHYANSKAMSGSLTEALSDLSITQTLVETILDPSACRAIDASHLRGKNRLNGLPRDEARQFFRSHGTRLLNLDKGRLDKLDKQIIDARRANMRTAEKSYIALQKTALGIEPQPLEQSRGRGVGRRI